MKKRLSAALILMLIIAVLTGCRGSGDAAADSSNGGIVISNAAQGEVFDVVYDKVPQSVVSTSGFTTEMLLALGLEDHISGYAYQDNEILPEYKEAFDKLRNLSDEFPAKEIVLEVKPDFLTGWESCFTEKWYSKEFCDSNGIKIYVPRVEYPNTTMSVVYEDFINLGKIFKVEDRAEKIVSDMKKAIEAVETKIAGQEAVRVFIYDSGEESAFTASAGLPTDMIRIAGGVNIAAGTDKNWIDYSWEKVIEQDPEVIIILKYNASDDVSGKISFLKNNPSLKDVSAIKNERFIVMGLSDVVGGVRNPAAIEAMAKAFHPALFE